MLTQPQIPYLTFSKERSEGVESEARNNYENLLAEYDEYVIHGSRTLDEFYYHFSSEERFLEDMRERNLDQVVTKAIDGSPDGNDDWTSVRVDQVWLWMLDEGTHSLVGPCTDHVFSNPWGQIRSSLRLLTGSMEARTHSSMELSIS